MKRRNIPETRRCCNGSNITRGRASHHAYIKGGISMSKNRVIKENEKAPKGHGPGGGTWGVKNVGKVGNKCPEGIGKGVIGSKVGRVNPGSNKGSE